MGNQSQATTQEQDQQILQGINKDLQTMTGLYLGGSAYTPGSLAALVQSRIDAANAVVTTKASWLSAVKAYQALSAEVTTVVRDLRNFLLGYFGEDAPQLADFGFKAAPAVPKMPEPQPEETPEPRSCGASRKARRTLGARKGKKGKGKHRAARPASLARA